MSPGSRWRSQKLWKPLDPYEVLEAVAELSEQPMSFAAYAAKKGYHRSALSEAIKEAAPDLYQRIMDEFAGTTGANRRSGASFETGVKGALERRGYYVNKSYASKSPLDMLAVGFDKPNLMVQAKRDGKLYFAEWNALYEIAVRHGCWPVLVRRPPGATRGFEWFRLIQAKTQRGQRNDGMMMPFEPRDPDQTTLLAPPGALVGSGS